MKNLKSVNTKIGFLILFLFANFAASAADGERTSTNGSKFTPDTSIAKFGSAVKDPSGLVWGGLIVLPSFPTREPGQFYDEMAQTHCKDVGGRLPTKAEFEQLAKYLGLAEHTIFNNYSAFLTDGADLVPGFSNTFYWSATRPVNHYEYAASFDSKIGETEYGLRWAYGASAICVAGK